MFPYRVKYTESEYDIQNNNLLYKIAPQCQNTYLISQWYPMTHFPGSRQEVSNQKMHNFKTLKWMHKVSTRLGVHKSKQYQRI